MALLAAAAACTRAPQDEPRLDIAAILGGGDTAGYARVEGPRPFVFPDDHGPHPQHRSEWWYCTGNLEGEGGRRFGYQLTFFRASAAPGAPERASAWATNQVYMAHLALTDVAGRSFHHHERLARGAAGLAGASARPFAVWLEDWRLDAEALEPLTLRLRAREGGTALDLRLVATKPIVPQGERGFSQKGPEPGNASHYYSSTRMASTGHVEAGGVRHAVRGASWLDREWGTSALGEGIAGWDWFALQFDDGRELMFYRLRRADGGMAPHSKGSLVAADGSVRVLRAMDVGLEELGRWSSPHSGATYPGRWRVRVPDAGLELELEPVLADQELRVALRYWEGAVDVRGTAAGRGYVELTGYR